METIGCVRQDLLIDLLGKTHDAFHINLINNCSVVNLLMPILTGPRIAAVWRLDQVYFPTAFRCSGTGARLLALFSDD